MQLWGYLTSVPECPWGIACNYVSFRLYHHHHARQQFEYFNLQELRDFPRFLQFYALFERGGLLPSITGEPPRADELIKQTESALKTVGAKLYDDYHRNRLELIDHLIKVKQKPLELAIHIAQKLMDRIVFIAFCKCRQLLPRQVIYEAAHHYSKFENVTNPRWQNFVKLFRCIDEGGAEGEIPAYNGGLFRTDPEVDDMNLLADKWTAFFQEIDTYDFESEINVDVLGRIFERSVTDLEAYRISALQPDAKPPTNGKRKREGIYYTPPRITRYIVEQSVGTLLKERFAALATQFGIAAPDDQPSQKTLANWLKFQMARLDAVSKFRILDPACGSGAFLIAAYDYLEDLYEEIIAALALQQGFPPEQLQALKDNIVRNNLFGTDLSGESVEITQLALWLRTAERGKTLADLSANIRRGNSLVDDSAVDEHAFNFHTEFPDVFAHGGFDCVIGNPPYVKLQNFKKYSPKSAAFLPTRYAAASTGNFDLYLPFIDRGVELLKTGGILGYIAPNVWIFNEYGQGLRNALLQNHFLARFVDFKSFQVFDDATTYTALQFFRKTPQEQIQVTDASAGVDHLQVVQSYSVPYAALGHAAWALLPEHQRILLSQMHKHSITLEEASEGVVVGIQTSADSIYHLVRIGPGKYFSEALNRVVEIEDAMMKPLISSEDPSPYATPEPPLYLLFPYGKTKGEMELIPESRLKAKSKKCWKYLLANESELRGREEGKMDGEGWYGYVYPKNLDKQELPKIGVPQTVNRLQAFIDIRGELYFNNVRINGILPRADNAYSLWYLLGILNSQAADYAFRRTAKPKDRDYFEANKQFIAPLPIPAAKPPKQKPVASLAEKIADLFGQQRAISAKVCRRIATDLKPKELLATSPLPVPVPAKLREFHTHDMRSLLDLLGDFAGTKLSPSQRESWQQYLTPEIESIQTIANQINDLQVSLDNLVFDLYGLSESQIEIIKTNR